VSTAPNQRPVAVAAAAHQVAEDAGPADELTPADLAGRLDALATDQVRRQAMVEASQKLVDGRGALRVVTRLSAGLLTLRPANSDDSRLLFEWANDPDVRARAFSRDPVPWETHTAWFADRLADGDSRIWVASDPEGELVGQVRFETRGGTTEVGVSVALAARGKGWGAALIDAGTRRLFAETGIEWVLARVKPDNQASRRAFESAEFDFDGEGSDNENTWVRYARRRDARGR
jgi:RimJ/RimL family protein N-acetyltransferase